MFKRLVDEGSLYGLGYWGGWSAGGEGILNSDLSFKFISINWKGRLLKEFFTSEPTLVPVPVPQPQPTPPVEIKEKWEGEILVGEVAVAKIKLRRLV